MLNFNEAKESRLVYFTCFLFFVLYVVAGFYNRLSHDDMAYLYGVKQDGIIDATIKNFESWNTRWAGVLTANFFFSFISIETNLLWFHLLTLGFFLLALYFLIHNLCGRAEVIIHSSNKLLFSICFCMLFFGCTFSIGDVWFWVNASCMYLWNAIFFVLAIAFILKDRDMFLGKLIIVICGLYIGGSSEPFAIIILLLTAISTGFSFSQHRSLSNRFIIFLFSVLVSFLFSCSGKGMELRSSALPQLDFIQKQIVFIKAVVKFFIFYFPFRFLVAMSLALPFYFIGRWLPQKLFKKVSFPRLVKYMLLSFLIIVFSVFYIITYKMGEMGPERSWTVISFFMAVIISSIALVAGNQYRYEWIYKSRIPLLVLVIFASVGFIGMQLVTLKKYASAYDKRFDNLISQMKEKNSERVVYLEALPPSGLLHSSEISADSNNFTNHFLQKYLDLPFAVVLDTNNSAP